MKVLGVTLENYGSYYGKHEIKLVDQGLVLVLGDNQDEPRMDSNGAAKSSIFEALDWCLFGVVPKGDHVDSVINDESSAMSVQVWLRDEDRNSTIAVVRKKTRNKAATLCYVIDGEKYELLDTRATQRRLEGELGLDRDVFHAAVFYAQSDALGFAESTEARRMELLSKILPELKQIDEWLPLAKEKAKECEGELGQYRAAYARAQTRAEEASVAVQQMGAQVQAWEDNRAQRALAIKRGRDQWLERRSAIRGALQERDTIQAELAQLSAPRLFELSELEQAERNAQQNQATWDAQAHSAAVQADRESRRIATLEQTGVGSCSLCGQQITPAHRAAELGRLQGEVQRCQAAKQQAQGHAAGWGNTLADVRRKLADARRQNQAAEVAHQQKRSALEARLESLGRAQAELDKTEQAIKDLEREHAEVLAAPNPVQQQKEQARARAGALVGEAQVALRQMQAWQAHLGLVEFWVSAFGQKGLRNYVLDHRLQEMTDAANRWVRLLTAGTIWVRFETQKMGRTSKRLSNEITIRVFRFNPSGKIAERNFRSWSGGEKRRVAWGIDFGLSRLIAARAQKRYDLLILDEVFRHVDAAGGEAVVEMLQELRRERSSIFVVEHDGAFQSHFEKRWLVTKRHARSSVQVDAQGGNHGAVAQADPGPEARPRKKHLPSRASAKAGGRAKRGASQVSRASGR